MRINNGFLKKSGNTNLLAAILAKHPWILGIILICFGGSTILTEGYNSFFFIRRVMICGALASILWSVYFILNFPPKPWKLIVILIMSCIISFLCVWKTLFSVGW